jgi:3-(3-hydroxy-phenyl)propionate hydroxylase
MVNAGRLSVPTIYDSPLSTHDRETWRGGPGPGTSMPDAPIAGPDARRSFLSDAFVEQGTRFTLLSFGDSAVATPEGMGAIRIGGEGGWLDCENLASGRYDALPGTAYLLRPDGYVAARFRQPTSAALEAALARAAGLN